MQSGQELWIFSKNTYTSAVIMVRTLNKNPSFLIQIKIYKLRPEMKTRIICPEGRALYKPSTRDILEE